MGEGAKLNRRLRLAWWAEVPEHSLARCHRTAARLTTGTSLSQPLSPPIRQSQ